MTGKTPLAAIILAAGASSRMGKPKQLLHVGGQSLIQQSVETALQAQCYPVVVLGAHADIIQPDIQDRPITIVVNEQWQEGIGASIRTGILKLMDVLPAAGAAIIMLCDQPLVTPALLRQLKETHQNSGKPIVVSQYKGILGVPALFHHTFFDVLLHLQGDMGARKLIQQYITQSASVNFSHGVIDLDTPEDYHDFLRKEQ